MGNSLQARPREDGTVRWGPALGERAEKSRPQCHSVKPEGTHLQSDVPLAIPSAVAEFIFSCLNILFKISVITNSDVSV